MSKNVKYEGWLTIWRSLLQEQLVPMKPSIHMQAIVKPIVMNKAGGWAKKEEREKKLRKISCSNCDISSTFIFDNDFGVFLSLFLGYPI